MAKEHIPWYTWGQIFDKKTPNFEIENYINNERSQIFSTENNSG